ncbi:MAG: restriction endonuclease subunit S [Planctomycetaceae bacterium]
MSVPRYKKYKDSGVEWLWDVPEQWEISRLGFESWVRARLGWKGLKAEEYVDDGFAFLSTPNIKGNEIDFENVNFIDQVRFDESPEIKLREGDVLLAKDGSTLGTVNVVRVLPRPTTVNSSIAVISPNQRLCGVYLYYLFESSYMEHTIQRIKGGMGVPHLFQADLNKFYMPVPPRDEQTKIASFLDRETSKIDELVGEQRRLIELLKEKRQAVISHAVTKGLNPHAPLKPSGNQWLGDVPEHWDVMRLKHVKSDDKNAFVDGPFGSNLKSEHFIDDGDAYVIESGFATQGRLDVADLKTITLEHLKTVSRSETKGGDIIIAKIGAQFGKSSILPTLDKPAVVSGNSLKLTINPQRCDVKFVNWHLTNLKQLGAIDDIVNGTAQPALSLGEMNNLPMLAPPLDEQQAIVNFLETQLREFDALTAEAERGIDLLQERRTALISAAVTGKIDVTQEFQS